MFAGGGLLIFTGIVLYISLVPCFFRHSVAAGYRDGSLIHARSNFARLPSKCARLAVRPDTRMRRLWHWPLICFLLVAGAVPLASVYSATPADVLLETMQRELHRASEALGKADPATYYLSYAVSDASSATIAGTTAA